MYVHVLGVVMSVYMVGFTLCECSDYIPYLVVDCKPNTLKFYSLYVAIDISDILNWILLYSYGMRINVIMFDSISFDFKLSS